MPTCGHSTNTFAVWASPVTPLPNSFRPGSSRRPRTCNGRDRRNEAAIFLECFRDADHDPARGERLDSRAAAAAQPPAAALSVIAERNVGAPALIERFVDA